MIVDVGNEGPFAEELSGVLEEKLVRDASPEDLDDESVLVASMDRSLHSDHRDLLRAGVARDSTLVLQSTSAESMLDLGLAGVAGGTVVVKSSDSGRRQQIVVDGDLGPTPEDPSEPSSASEPQQTPTRLGLDREAPRDAPRSAEMVLDAIATESEDGKGWTRDNPALATIRLKIPETISRAADGSESRIYGSFLIQLAAIDRPLRVKTLRIRSDDTAVWAVPAADTPTRRGCFTIGGGVKYYPIDLADSSSWPSGYEFPLPTGWQRIHIAPETPNESSTYTSTTGWSVGPKVGADAEGPSLSLEASYSESNSTTSTIKDFRVRNYSTAAVSNWEYEYSLLADNMWALQKNKLFRWPKVKPLAGLAKSRLTMGNETVYEAPPDCEDHQAFHFEFGHHLAKYSQTGSSYFNSGLTRDGWDPIGVQVPLVIPMGLVRHGS